MRKASTSPARWSSGYGGGTRPSSSPNPASGPEERHFVERPLLPPFSALVWDAFRDWGNHGKASDFTDRHRLAADHLRAVWPLQRRDHGIEPAGRQDARQLPGAADRQPAVERPWLRHRLRLGL